MLYVHLSSLFFPFQDLWKFIKVTEKAYWPELASFTKKTCNSRNFDILGKSCHYFQGPFLLESVVFCTITSFAFHGFIEFISEYLHCLHLLMDRKWANYNCYTYLWSYSPINVQIISLP